MEIGDARVVGVSCADTIWTSLEGLLGQEGSAPPHRKNIGQQEEREGRVKNSYVKISN